MVAAVERRIVVGVDGSESSRLALKWAAGQAQSTGAVLEVITSWEWPTSFGWTMPYVDGWNPSADAQKIVDEIVEPVHRAHPDVVIRTRVIEGHAAPVLVDASNGAELLVVGSRGHGEFAGMLLGSVSEHCVAHAHCPVLVRRDQG